MSLAAAQSAIPLKIVDKLPYIPVQIEGKIFLMMLDLGADDNVSLAPQTIRTIHLEQTEGSYRHFDAKGNVIEARRLRIPELRIGGMIFKNVDADEQQFALDYHPPDVSRGHVGLGLLRDYKIALDYGRRQMWLIANDSGAPGQRRCQGVAIPRLPANAVIMETKAQTDMGELTLEWDTGSQANILRRPDAPASKADGDEPPRVQSRRFALGDVDFGPVSFYAVNFARPADVDGVVGYEFFAKHAVCFDLAGQQLIVSR
jgi:hypothetical protein